MRFMTLVLLILVTFHGAAGAASLAGKKYFDMPVAEWLKLSEGEQVESSLELLSLNRQVSRQQAEAVATCMRVIGRSPVWEGSTAGTLLTKCAFDMGVARGAREKEWDALVECVKKEVPDFTKEEIFALGLSAAGAALAKDAGSEPMLTPRTRKVLGVIDGCGKKQ